MLAESEKEAMATALRYADGQRAVYAQLAGALRLTLLVEGVDADAILGTEPLVPAPEGSRVLVADKPRSRRRAK